MMTMHNLQVPLPANQTPLENAVAALTDRIVDIDVPLRDLINPRKCPVEFLPLLAWAYSVDVWDPNWPEETKRRVIEAAPEVHRLKGTRKAVVMALEALGVEANIVEWWEETPPALRGTFKINVLHTSAGYADHPLRDQIVDSVFRSKPVSRSVAISHWLRQSNTAYVGAAMRHRHKIRILAEQPLPVFDGAPLGMGTGIRIRSKVQTTVVAAAGLSDGALMTQQGQALRTHNGVHIVTGNDA